MILVVSALKGGVGKTTTSVYLAAVAASTGKRSVTIVDADPQASASEWVEGTEDGWLQGIELVEAPTARLLTKALARIDADDVAIVDTPPGQERLLADALALSHVAVVPTRVGGVETSQAEAAFALVPKKVPAGLVITSARTYTRDYAEAEAAWREADVPVWGTVPERVTIAAGPTGWLSAEGVDAYKQVWRRATRAAR